MGRNFLYYLVYLTLKDVFCEEQNEQYRAVSCWFTVFLCRTERAVPCGVLLVYCISVKNRTNSNMRCLPGSLYFCAEQNEQYRAVSCRSTVFPCRTERTVPCGVLQVHCFSVQNKTNSTVRCLAGSLYFCAEQNEQYRAVSCRSTVFLYRLKLHDILACG